jgi:hypothetical protein
METLFPCPKCHSPGHFLMIDETAEMDQVTYKQAPGVMPYVETKRRPANVAFCEQCPFSIEILR